MILPVAAPAVPNPFFCAPIRWISDKIRAVAEAVFGYLLRIVTFQLGEMKTRGAPIIMRIYQKLSSDPREERPFDPARLEESRKFLTQFGVETVVPSADGEQIHTMTFKSADFFAALRAKGAVSIDIVHEGRARKALLNLPKDIAAKFYAPLIDIKMPDGTIQKGALLPDSPPPNAETAEILDCHSPGRSMCMNRRMIWLFVAAGYNLTIWDPRGTADSTGRPSEGGYYLDAEAVMQQLLNRNVNPNRIYVSGFCEGAAVAAHLKKKYHHLGVHYIASNPYTSMRDVVEGHGWLGRMGVKYGLAALQDPRINLVQDDFDNVEKLRNLPRSTGKCVFVHTDTDKLMPPGTVQKLCEAFGEAGPIHEILRDHPDPTANGHMEPPYQDTRIWRRFVQVVS